MAKAIEKDYVLIFIQDVEAASSIQKWMRCFIIQQESTRCWRIPAPEEGPKDEKWTRPQVNADGGWTLFRVAQVSPDESHVAVNRGDNDEVISRDRVEIARSPECEVKIPKERLSACRDEAEYAVEDIVLQKFAKDSPE